MTSSIGSAARMGFITGLRSAPLHYAIGPGWRDRKVVRHLHGYRGSRRRKGESRRAACA
jgi:hypothetical protein